MKIGIIGGGIMGLTLAYRLSKAAYQVDIIESRDQIGGLSTWFNYGSFTWDKYYHVILQQDHELIGLINELGLGSKLRWKETRTGFLWKKQCISMSNYGEFLRFPALSIFEKIRLGLGILYSRYIQKLETLTGITAEEWLTRVFGKKIFATIWEPLLESKYGVLKAKIPAVQLWATINRYYGTRDKTAGKERMGYLEGGGLKVLIDALVQRITFSGGTIHCGEKVIKIADQQPIYVQTNTREYHFDRVISTLPAVLTEKFMPHILKRTSSGSPEFLGVIRLALVLNQSLTSYYVTNLIEKNIPYTGIIEVSQIVDPKEFENKTLVMIPRYDVPSSEWFSMPEEEIKNRFLTALKDVWPSIEEYIFASYVHKEPVVQAIWISGSPEAKPPTSPDKRIWNISAELAGNDNLNNNAIVKTADRWIKDFISQEKIS